jgi:hypothetical protein
MRFHPTSFRPVFGRVLSVIVGVIAATGLAGFLVAGDLAELARFGWGLLLIGAVVFALFWFPRIDIAEHEVTVRNVFSTVHVPWPAIQRVDTKYALTLHTLGGIVTAWASPAPNRYASQRSSRDSARIAGDPVGFAPRPGDLLETESGAPAYLIRRHLDDLREAGHLDAPVLEGGRLRRDIHWATIAVLGALTLATVLGIVL